MNVLFVCTAGMQRSPTGAELFARKGYDTKYAGMLARDEAELTADKLRWADHVVVMESRHRRFIKQNFPKLYDSTPVTTLNIPDIYVKNDPELVQMIEEKMEGILRDS